MFWRVIDALLDKMGLIRKSRQFVQRLDIQRRQGGPDYIVVELRNGFRYSGYLGTTVGVITHRDNPLLAP